MYRPSYFHSPGAEKGRKITEKNSVKVTFTPAVHMIVSALLL